MRLFITEKPSTARQLTAVLGDARHVKSSNSTKFGGHKQGSGWAVAWLSGHFYSLLEPHEFDERYKQWRLSDLPFIANECHWKVNDDDSFPPKQEIEEQIAHIQSLYKNTNELILATDGDQEGQVLGQVFLEQSGWRGPVKRLWTDVWEPEGLRKRLANLRDNQEFQGIFEAGKCRVLGDQLIGINLTRLFTQKAREAGYSLTAKVGRVRSPALSFTVDHHAKVTAHTARLYYGVRAHLDYQGTPFKGSLIVPEDWCEDKKHCFDPSPVQALLDRLDGITTATVQSKTQNRSEQKPPKPFNQNTLSQHCSKHFQMMPDEVMNVSQKLYEDGVLSYPRVDAQAYEAEVLDMVPAIFETASSADPALASAIENADVRRPQPVFVDEAIEGHSAIYITRSRPELSKRSREERQVYMAIAIRMIAQFYPSLITASEKLILAIGEGRFQADSSTVVQYGWASIEPYQHEDKATLPPLSEGDLCNVVELERTEQNTKAPSRMTVELFQETLRDCTHLLSPKIKSRVGTGQLGTGATQKEYLKSLVNQGAVQIESKKYVIPTRRGIELRSLLPAMIASPDLTSLWELNFRAIRAGQTDPKVFMDTLITWLKDFVRKAENVKFAPAPTMTPCERCGSALNRRERAGDKFNYYWTCSSSECSTTVPDDGGRPAKLHPRDGMSCPKCESPLRTRLRKKDKKIFAGCSSRQCKYLED